MSSVHIDYHAVLMAFRDHTDACPLCMSVREGEEAFWDSVLYGQVGTEGFQDGFLRTDGFCPAHAADFGRRKDGVAVTMLYAPLMKHRLHWLTRLEGRTVRLPRPGGRPAQIASSGRKGRKGKKGRLPPERAGRLAHPGDCPLCTRTETRTHRFLINLLRHQHMDELRKAVEAGVGLCVPHYRQMAETAAVGLFRRTPRISPWLRIHHRQYWDQVIARAEEETATRGGTAWKELLRIMAGDNIS
jgi:hypothetical protein